MIRSCYKSSWNFPGIGEVEGRYFFNDNAPFWEDWTYFGSANWHKGDGSPWPEFGEMEVPQKWSNGKPPPQMPLVKTVGPLDQIAGDAPIDPASRPGLFGLPLLCYGEIMSITVQSIGGTPSFADTLVLAFNYLDGFEIEQPSSNQVNVNYVSASSIQKGAIDTQAQSFAGAKTFLQTVEAYRGAGDFQYVLNRADGTIGMGLQSYTSGSLNHNIIWARSFASVDGFVRAAIGYSPDLNTGAGFLVELSGDYDNAAIAYFAVSDGAGNIYAGTTGTFAGLDVRGGLITGGAFAVSWASITSTPTTLAGYGIGDAQPLDADLTALAALTGTNTIYYRSGVATWSAVTVGTGLSFAAGTLTNTITGVSDGDYGDVSVSGTGSVWTVDSCAITALAPIAGLTTATIADGDTLAFSDTSASEANKKTTALALASYILPPGSLIPFAGGTIPSGFLDCDGSAVSRSTFAALFSAIGITWGAGNGTTTFNVPDLRGRAMIGAGTGSGLSPRNLGSTGGTETHTLSTPEIPGHTHTVVSGTGLFVCSTGAGVNNFTPTGGVSTTSASATDSTGGGGAHTNMQPFAVTKWLIRT